MQVAFAIEQIESKYQSLASVLDERARRHWSANEARAYGWGGVSAVSEATGMSPDTIRKGEPERVDVHDFPDPDLGKVIPYGVFDLSRKEGWVSVGIDHDTAQFAAQAIGRWRHKMGRKRYSHASALLITADDGGSNGSRCRLWKVALQTLAARLGLPFHVCHCPPGTSKWNKIEHRMFSHITQNWRGRPLVSHEVIVNLIANTTTQAGLTFMANGTTRYYRCERKLSYFIYARSLSPTL